MEKTHSVENIGFERKSLTESNFPFADLVMTNKNAFNDPDEGERWDDNFLSILYVIS